ncbi:SAV_915 family protein [Streptomyces sp. NPDC048211]|uniref:SAV_915 family protein n=1 Tax=Streptomyces sp. NPDC048211 TaxID=3365516 RepID=UPI003717423B
MNDSPCAEDLDPLDANRAGTLFVPARPGPAGYSARLFRTPLGGRTAVAFTDERRLTRTLGQQQGWIRLSEPAVRALVAPLGIVDLTVDPLLAAPGPGAAPAAGPGDGRTAGKPQREHRPARDPRPLETRRVSSAASLSSSAS